MALITDPAAATAFIHGSIPALARFGVTVEAVSPGRVRLRMPIEANANHVGTMYAGALFAAAELPAGVLPWTVLDALDVVPIAKEASIRFRRPAFTDVTVEATTPASAILDLAERARQQGKAEYTLELQGRDADGAVVLTATTVSQLRLIQH